MIASRRQLLLLFFSAFALLVLFWQLDVGQSTSSDGAHSEAHRRVHVSSSPSSTDGSHGDEEATTTAVRVDSSFAAHGRKVHSSSTERTSSANRAPFLVPRRIASADSSPPLNSGPEKIECWDHLGAPARTPTFVPPLFSKIGSVDAYRDLHGATEDDPWLVLMGLVPSRFMGPQPEGKDSQGRRMVPPTRGRDPKFYLREYNASWHVSFEDEGKKHYFQIMHRNVFAVCIRERIHLHVRRCRPSPELPPILIYSCLCRKCEEKSLLAAGPGSLQQQQQQRPKLNPQILHLNANDKLRSLSSSKVPRPEFLFLARSFLLHNSAVQTLLRVSSPNSSPSMSVANIVKFPPKSSQCLSVLAAPWLVSKSVVGKFPYEGLEQDLDALLALQAEKPRRHVMVAMFNAAWVDHLLNWVFSLGRNGMIASYIIATMDTASLDLCRSLRLPCYDAEAMAEKEVDEELRLHPEKRRVSEAMSWIKPRLAVAVLGRGYGFWMVDLDMSWNANPIPHVVATAGGDKLDLVHQCDSPARFSINSGFYDASPTLSSYLFFSNMMTFIPQENADQAAMRLFGRYDHTHGSGKFNDCLNKWQFDMKCNYKVSNSVRTFKLPGVAAMQQSFEWNPVERNRSKFHWIMHHATCLSGAMAKVSYLRTINAWFLDDLEEWEKKQNRQSEQGEDAAGWCWTLTSGETVRVKSLEGEKTPFSPKYVREIDQTFLQRRH